MTKRFRSVRCAAALAVLLSFSVPAYADIPCIEGSIRDASGQCCLQAELGCDGICFSGRVLDCAGVCNGNAKRDCAGVCNGQAELDCAGVCNGTAVKDCRGVCNGTTVIGCDGFCGSGKVKDCRNICGGGWTWDNCAHCLPPNNPTRDSCSQDCRTGGEAPVGGTFAWTCITVPAGGISWEQYGSYQAWQHSYPSHWLWVWGYGIGFTYNETSRQLCACQRVTGCFDPRTPITLVDGSRKQADEVRAGDVLLNPLTNEGLEVDKVVESGEDKPLVELGYGNVILHVTDGHPVLTKDRGLQRAGDLTLNDSVLGADLEWHRLDILTLLPVSYGQRVLNFIVKTSSADEAGHMLDSGGIVTGDLFLQQQLKR